MGRKFLRLRGNTQSGRLQMTNRDYSKWNNMSSTPWTPADIVTSAWYDATDESTITESGGAVSQWADKSGNDNHVTQGTGVNQPTYTNNIVTFDGDDFMFNSSPTGLPSGTDSGAIYIVTELDSNTGAWGNIVSYGNGNIGEARTLLRIDGSAEFGVDTYAGGLYTGYDFVVGETNILGGVYDSATQYGFVNGSATPTPSASNAFNTVVNSLYLSGRVENGDENQAQQMREVLIVSDTTDETRQKIEGYLAHKWGLTANLPVDHPYKTNPPTV